MTAKFALIVSSAFVPPAVELLTATVMASALSRRRLTLFEPVSAVSE